MIKAIIYSTPWKTRVLIASIRCHNILTPGLCISLLTWNAEIMILSRYHWYQTINEFSYLNENKAYNPINMQVMLYIICVLYNSSQFYCQYATWDDIYYCSYHKQINLHTYFLHAENYSSNTFISSYNSLTIPIMKVPFGRIFYLSSGAFMFLKK